MNTEELKKNSNIMKWDLIEACIAKGLDIGVEELVIAMKERYDNTDDEKLKHTITHSIYWIVDAHLHAPTLEEKE